MNNAVDRIVSIIPITILRAKNVVIGSKKVIA
jgi:hypothetical protein